MSITKELTTAIRADKDLFLAFQANIAMPFKDKAHELGLVSPDGKDDELLHEVANEAAAQFLDLLIYLDEKE